MTIRLIVMELGRFIRVERRRQKRRRLSSIIAPEHQLASCASPRIPKEACLGRDAARTALEPARGEYSDAVPHLKAAAQAANAQNLQIRPTLAHSRKKEP
jgi:hypothetical protein